MKKVASIIAVIVVNMVVFISSSAYALDPSEIDEYGNIIRTAYMQRAFVDTMYPNARPELMICRADFIYAADYHAGRGFDREDRSIPFYEEKMKVSRIVGSLFTAFVNRGWRIVVPQEGEQISDCAVTVVINDNFEVKATVSAGPDNAQSLYYRRSYSDVDYFGLAEEKLRNKLGNEGILPY